MNLDIHVSQIDLMMISPAVHQLEEEKKKKRGNAYTTPEERAAKCHTKTTWGGGNAFTAPCRQWRICVCCFRHRIKTWAEYIHQARLLVGGSWQYKRFPIELMPMLRRELQDHGLFLFPIGKDVIALSPYFSDGTPVPVCSNELAEKVKEWVKTPLGRRPYRSPNCIKREVSRPVGMAFTADVDFGAFQEMVESLGDGSTFTRSKHHLQYDGVDDLQLAYEFALQDRSVRTAGSCIILFPHAPMLASVRDKRCDEWLENNPDRANWYEEDDLDWL